MPRQKLGRSWGTRFDALAAVDSVPSSPECTLTHPQKLKPAIQMGESDNNHDRVVHDASIFIGSLPSHIEHVELLAMLSDHFSGYSQIQGIKVVRDNKGGTCAFIQCQNPGSAASLLLNLRSSPRPFLGRYLRYEPARAFRALLVSYRSPRQCNQNAQTGEKTTRPEDSGFTELELPTAMKLTKIPGTRRVSVLYNSDATPESPDDRSGSISLLLQPLLYDADTLRRIATFFGPVEHFKPCTPDKDTLGYPNPHDSPRSSTMDLDCWEVKWVHRDDCMNALTTLRRVPHLTVTWAHESDSETHNPQQSNGSCSTFLTPSGSLRTDGATRDDIHSPESNHSVPSTHSVQDFSSNDRNLPTDQVDPVAGLDPDKREQKTFPTTGTRPQQFRPRALSLNQACTRTLLPPVSTQVNEKLLSFSWELSRETQRAQQLTTPQRFSSVSESKTFPSTVFAPLPAAHMASTGFGMPSNHTRQGPDTDILHRPEFETSAVQKSSGPCVPLTPTSGSGMKSNQRMSFQSPRREAIPSLPEEMKVGPVHDPTTVFVGGLEMRGPKAWDERKLRVLFSKYGGIKSVKVVRPTNKRLCFAFVTFDNTESSARAIAEEHNRILDGRPIRVQLRDLHPFRRISWQIPQTKDPSCRRSESPTVSGDDSHDNSRNDRSDISNVTDDLDGLGLGNSSSEDVAQFTPGINTSIPLQNVARESQLHNSGHIESEDPSCHTSGNVIARSSESRETSAGVSALPRVSTASSHAPLIPGPFIPTPYSVPAIAYYPPQRGVPGCGAQFLYQQPFLTQPYMGYPLPPQPMPPYIQRSSAAAGSMPSSNPTPTGVFESAQGLPIVYPACAIGHPATDADLGQTGTFTPSTDSYYVPRWTRYGFDSNQGVWFHLPWDSLDEHIPDQETNPFGTADTSLVPTCLPYPPAGAPLQPPSVFVQPFSHPLPYPGHAVAPHGWVTGQPGWHGVMPQPSHTPQTLPSGTQFNPASTARLAETTPFKFERNVPAHRYSRRDSYFQYHKNNNNGRGSGGRQSRPMIAPQGPVIQDR